MEQTAELIGRFDKQTGKFVCTHPTIRLAGSLVNCGTYLLLTLGPESKPLLSGSPDEDLANRT